MPADHTLLELDRFLPYRLSVLSNRISQDLARLYAERFDLSVTEWRVLAVLGRYPNLSANEVAERTAMDKVAVSRAVTSLLECSRLKRRTHGSDRRRSVLALRPNERRPGGLELALQQLATRSTVDGRVTSTFEGDGGTTALPPEHEHELLRIAQEAVSNALRHAQPGTVKITLTTEHDALCMGVTDDGCGMDDLPESCAEQGFGLANMRKRAEAIGGEWRIVSSRGQGTRISVRLPRPKPT